MRRPSFTNRKLVALALIAGAGGACSEDASDSTGQEEYVQQIQSELDAAQVSNPATYNSVKPVRPVLKCVEKLANSQYKAHFGYTNSASSSVSIPVGFFNRFWPPPIGRGQPTAFAPGSQADVVQVPFSGYSASIWVLGNHFAVATKYSKICPVGGTGGANGAGGAGMGGAGMGGAAGAGMGGAGMGGAGMGGAAGAGMGGAGMGGAGMGGAAGAGVGGAAGAGVGGAAGAGVGGAAGEGMGGTAGTGAGGAAGEGMGGRCGLSTCDDQNPCTIDTLDSVACVCVHIAALDGVMCDDGNLCTLVDSCVAGVCTGGSPKPCTALDQCHIAGVCAPATGVCSNPVAPNGVTCSDGNACTVSDICTDGICTMGTPVLCNAPDACHTPGTCDRTTGACSNPSAPNGTMCNDGNACTTVDTCQAGACTGGSAVVCAPSDQCHIAGACNPANGVCSNPTAPNGATCSDGNACTTGEACQNGTCSGGTARVCAATDSCHSAGTCDPTSGTCSNPPVADGTACSDSNGCTTGDSCRAGTCVSGAPVICPPASDSCHIAGVCSPTTGLCSGGVVADGTPCDDGNLCSTGDTCRAGVCTAAAVVPPSHCDALVCEQCTFGVESTPGQPDRCSSSNEGCFNCFPQTDGCDLLADPADRTLCENLYACLVAPTHAGSASFPGFCISQGDPLGCWCGSNPTTCVTDNVPPTQANGPCLQQVFAAAKTTDAATINLRFIDPTFPLGRAVNLASCRSNFCSSSCGVNF